MKNIVLPMVALATLASACDEGRNYLLDNEFDTPHNLPPFELIANSHYVPAFEEAIADVNRSIELITLCADEPTFHNTIIPLDRCGMHLERLNLLFGNLMESDLSDTMQVMSSTILPMIASHKDDVYQNKALFERVRKVYESRLSSGLDSVQIRVAELYYRDFVRNGALLEAKDAARLREINQQLTLLCRKFSNNVLAETNGFKLVIDSVADLAGLPDNVVAAAALTARNMGLVKEGEPDKWVFTLHKSSVLAFLQYADNHDLRKQLYDAYCARARQGGEFDNNELIKQIVALRTEMAKLLGYKSYAHYAIQVNMAQSPEVVDSFLQQVWSPALDLAKSELDNLYKFARSIDKNVKIESCDWFYWTNKLRLDKYRLDESVVSQYFELSCVRKGMFDCASKLYGISFEQLNDVPLYNPNDNEVWKVSDADGSCLGVVYFDWFPRKSKSNGAWCTSFREALDNFDGSHTEAQVSICCNFTKPVGETPALLSFDEVETMFHEFGHALQALFTKGLYVRTAGNVPGDYVEMPSQINELWVADRNVIKSFAKHYISGEQIPDQLLDNIFSMGNFNQGFASTEFLAAAILDLKLHSLSSSESLTDVDAFEKRVFANIGLMPEIEPRYHAAYFTHIFGGGYAAGYYDYEWAEMLVCDLFNAFNESGDIFNSQVAANFRKLCLSEIGDYDLQEQFVKFRGHAPMVEPLMSHRGFDEVIAGRAKASARKPVAKAPAAKQ